MGVGIGSDKGDASSTTTSGISGIAGNTGVRAGDAEAGLKTIFDAAKVQREIDAQLAITQAFSREAPKAVATFATGQMASLKAQADAQTDPEKKQALLDEVGMWDEGGRYRVLLHTLAGAFSGGAGGAAGAVASSSSAPLMNQLQDSMASGLQAAGLGADAAKGIAQGITGLTVAAVGAAVGDAQGAATAFGVDVNNRQLHQDQFDYARKNSKQVAAALSKREGREVNADEAEGRMVAEMLRNSDQQANTASGGIHDYSLRSVVGCQNLACDLAATDPNAYKDPSINQQYIAPNSNTYAKGLSFNSDGLTYNQLVAGNIKKDPVGSTLAGAGLAALGVATGGGIPALGAIAAGGAIGGAANIAVQYGLSGKVDSIDVAMAVGTGALSSGTNLVPALLINVGGVVTGAGIKGENPNSGAGGAAAGTIFGYGLGKALETSLDKVLNQWWRTEWKDVGFGLSVFTPKNTVPFVMGTSGSSLSQEISGDVTKKKIDGAP